MPPSPSSFPFKFNPISTAASVLAEPPPSASQTMAERHSGHIASALERLGDGVARLRMEFPEIAHAATGEQLLKHDHVRIPAAAEALEPGIAGDAAMRQDESRALPLWPQFVGDDATLAALERGLEQPWRVEAQHFLVPHRPFVAFVLLGIGNVIGRQLVVIDHQIILAETGCIGPAHEPLAAQLGV